MKKDLSVCLSCIRQDAATQPKKKIRAMSYPDDEYFFLKVMDVSRKKYNRNQRSHKIND